MASHGWEEKGPESAADEAIDGGAHDRRKVRDSTAANSDRDARARAQMRNKIAGRELAMNGRRDVVEFSVREMLSNWQEHAVPIIESARCYANDGRGTMPPQDDARENRIVDLFNLERPADRVRHGIDAILNIDNHTLEFELKSVTTAGGGSLRSETSGLTTLRNGSTNIG
jgi:hypothetical protein